MVQLVNTKVQVLRPSPSQKVSLCKSFFLFSNFVINPKSLLGEMMWWSSDADQSHASMCSRCSIPTTQSCAEPDPLPLEPSWKPPWLRTSAHPFPQYRSGREKKHVLCNWTLSALLEDLQKKMYIQYLVLGWRRFIALNGFLWRW